MQKIGKCKQNVKLSQKVNTWEGHNVMLSMCRSLQDKLGGINLLTIISIGHNYLSGIGISKWELFKRYKMNRKLFNFC